MGSEATDCAFRRAAEIVRVRGKMSVLMINDIVSPGYLFGTGSGAAAMPNSPVLTQQTMALVS